MSEIPRFRGRDILSLREFDREELMYLLETARVAGSDLPAIRSRMKGRYLYYAFYEPSTRTRFSFIYAARALGLWPKGFSSAQSTSALKGEPLKDTLKMVEGYGADCVVLRHGLAGAAAWAAENLDVPVINAGDGSHEHPTQTMLDLYSILETQFPDERWTDLPDLKGLDVALVGDLKYGRTVHSLALALATLGRCRLHFVSPPSLQMPAQYLETLRRQGIECHVYEDVEEVATKCDVLYATRIQRERFPDPSEYESVKSSFTITAKTLDGARPNLKVLHPLPRNRESLELDFSVDETPYAYYYQQARNGLTVRRALLALVGGGVETGRFEREVPRPGDESSHFKQVDSAQMRPSKAKPRHIFLIEHGTVLDHLPAGTSGRVRRLLDIPGGYQLLTAENLKSRVVEGGRKDMLKIIGFEPSRYELDQIALVAPQATISLIRNGSVVAKGRAHLPDHIHGLIRCPHPGCISRPEHNEGAHSIFRTESRSPMVLSCHYCDSLVEAGNLALWEGIA